MNSKLIKITKEKVDKMSTMEKIIDFGYLLNDIEITEDEVEKELKERNDNE